MRNPKTNRLRNNILARLSDLDIPEKDFCLAHGFQQSHFNKIKNRRLEPNGVLMLRIAQAFGVPVDEIFSLVPTDEEGNRNPPFTGCPGLTAHALDRQQLVAAADAAGVASISAPRLGPLAGVNSGAAWRWLRGIPVAEATDQALRAALGLWEPEA